MSFSIRPTRLSDLAGHIRAAPMSATERDPPAPIVVKIGGSTLGEGDSFLDDIAEMWREGYRLIVVHGGGKTISEWVAKQGIRPEFVRGLRKTDRASLDVAVAVLAGKINNELTAELHGMGLPAVGISGVSLGMLQAEILDPTMGYVGKVMDADIRLLSLLIDNGMLPVVAPIAFNLDAENRPMNDLSPSWMLNINADISAGYIARAIIAEKLVFQTDVPGVMDGHRRVIPRMTRQQALAMIESKIAVGGMIPKLEACVLALETARSAHIVDGRIPGALRMCLTGEEAGTRIV